MRLFNFLDGPCFMSEPRPWICTRTRSSVQYARLKTRLLPYEEGSNQ